VSSVFIALYIFKYFCYIYDDDDDDILYFTFL